MNTVSGTANSMTSLATSVFGNARQAFKAMAEAATNQQFGADTAATAQATPGRSARRGTILDRYI
ncbi:hypothetical protein ACWT_5094 [Actinoplanes sp. SE50]|nr:hypothetical protein ACPL_5224 [Actinoplanes sp. SE50/110]ATO84509.1 hypothetical protein ACWT_5094 [Actinoplanes sp. SE50]SLM01919.1 hypothetical protein ACSP50_5157 [Actinoplanes sp. SE50/110]